jgi:D-glycero-alpha-D-manno-heptose 1-phosphate guanylyltransferase
MQQLHALILCGGRGTRLASVVSDVPKPLAPVLGRPFLDYLLDHLAASGVVSGVTLATHHMSEKIADHYRAHPPKLPLRVLREDVPLGTGGAIFNAFSSIRDATILAFNGDSLVGGDLDHLVATHQAKRHGVTLGLVRVEDTRRYGRVEIDASGRVTAFHEKAADAGVGLINAGVYVISREALGAWDGQALSIETGVLPRLALAGLVGGEVLAGPFIDIGLPETYEAARVFVQQFPVGATFAQGRVPEASARPTRERNP